MTGTGLKNTKQDSLSVLQEADVRFSEVLLNMIIRVLKQVMDSVPEKKGSPQLAWIKKTCSHRGSNCSRFKAKISGQ